MVDPELLEILACPNCKTKVELVKDGTALKCPQCRRVYPIKDDIPVMLIDEATIEPYVDHPAAALASHGRRGGHDADRCGAAARVSAGADLLPRRARRRSDRRRQSAPGRGDRGAAAPRHPARDR